MDCSLFVSKNVCDKREDELELPSESVRFTRSGS